MGRTGGLCDVPVVDLDRDPPVINSVIKQVGDGVESFAFHPNGKMAVVTCLSQYNNSIAVLDIESSPPRLLYHLDVGGIAQGIEFSPDGEKLFVGSAFANRIEVFDVVGEFELRKNQKFLKTGHGHCSLTIGPTYQN
jgi:WD40 repeat protein